MERDDLALARRLAEGVAARGGRVYFVGGCVRDKLTGVPVKDIDVEVYGVEPAVLREELAKLGQVLDKGAAFGVLGLAHSGLDVAMPRLESRTGELHTDFDVSVNPFLSTREASRRRDFTCNALMEDVLTGEITDNWGGREDLQAGVLRMVCAETFGEDALRAFRAAQFAARLPAAIEPATMAACRDMDVRHISRERVYEETVKALMKARKPSAYFRALREMDHLKEFFPEVEKCVGVPQNPVYHPEGDVFEHTMLVLDAAAALRGRAQWPLGFMFAALCHDLGKAVCTEITPEGKIISYGHEVKGLPLAEGQMCRLTNQGRLIRYVRSMVELHMRPNMMARGKSKKSRTRALFDQSVCPLDLILLSRADATGKLDEPYDESLEKFLLDRYADYRGVMARPMVTGEDLAAAGVAPGPEMGELLKRARQLHFSGLERPRALAQVMGEYRAAHGRGED